MLEVPTPTAVAPDFGLDDLIAKSRGVRRVALEAARDRIVERYAEYMANVTRLEIVDNPGVDPDLKAHLHAKYEVMRRKIAPHLSLKCPNCQLRHATTWDHYLPKEHYAHFSLLRHNLIWVCPTCNQKKGDRNISPQRSVLNAYYDGVYRNIELKCEWLLDGGFIGLNFYIATRPAANPYVADIANRHFALFELAPFFCAEAGNHVTVFLDEVREERAYQDSWEAALVAVVRRRLGDMRRRELPATHWEYALWKGASDNVPGLAQHLDA